MKTINIEIPEGHEIDQEKSNLAKGKIVFKKSKKALPKTWEELIRVEGYYINSSGYVIDYEGVVNNSNKTLFASLKQAKASIALAQLSQLREVYRQGWVPDWGKQDNKYCIEFFDKNIIQIESWARRNYFLSFQSRAIAEEFLENFRDLIEQSLPLMS